MCVRESSSHFGQTIYLQDKSEESMIWIERVCMCVCGGGIDVFEEGGGLPHSCELVSGIIEF